MEEIISAIVINAIIAIILVLISIGGSIRKVRYDDIDEAITHKEIDAGGNKVNIAYRKQLTKKCAIGDVIDVGVQLEIKDKYCDKCYISKQLNTDDYRVCMKHGFVCVGAMRPSGQSISFHKANK